MQEKKFFLLLEKASALGISDIFLVAEERVFWRQEGILLPLHEYEASKRDIENIWLKIASAETQREFLCNKEADFTWEFQRRRYRIHAYLTKGNVALAIRVFPKEIPRLEDIGQAGKVRQFMDHEDGLLLITGATGAGKTTTVAAMLAAYNERWNYHILTLEDPVEYLYPKGKCLFSQQEKGKDFFDYERGIISALRENPDIIMIAELRDGRTCEAALSAAASGHYVIATMHTGGAVETVERLISMVETNKQNLAKSLLSTALRGICSQKLHRGGNGKQFCAVEILKGNNAVSNIIRSGKYEQLTSVMQAGKEQGMQTMNMALERMDDG